MAFQTFQHHFICATDELDSYMYQTVGHQAVELYAEAMDLPLYRRTIQGSSLDTSRCYSETEGDEVEDLYELLLLVRVCLPASLLLSQKDVIQQRRFCLCGSCLFLYPPFVYLDFFVIL